MVTKPRKLLFVASLAVLAVLPRAIVHHQGEHQTTRDSWTPESVPNPATNPKQCGLNTTGRICDPDLLLSAADRQQIQQVLQEVDQKTKLQCPDGKNHSYQVAVLVVKNIARSEWIGAFGAHTWLFGKKEVTGEHFAHRVGDLWGVGDAGCDNGLMLFLSVDDRMFYLKTAKQTREVLWDSEAETILKNMKPLLQKGDTGAAILRGTEEILEALEGKRVPVYHTWTDYLLYTVLALCVCINLPQILALLIIGLAFVTMLIAWPCAKLADAVSAGWRRLFPSSAQKDLQRVQKEMEKDEFDQSMCPICLENFGSEEAADVQVLSCKHRFHKKCIEEWVQAKESCPLCRADVGAEFALSDEDGQKSEHYQRRLRFYLSRLAQRHPGTFRTSRNSPMYYSSDDTYFLYVPHHSYADSVTSSFHSATTVATSSMGGHGGGGGGFGGGGFGGGGGAGGGW